MLLLCTQSPGRLTKYARTQRPPGTWRACVRRHMGAAVSQLRVHVGFSRCADLLTIAACSPIAQVARRGDLCLGCDLVVAQGPVASVEGKYCDRVGLRDVNSSHAKLADCWTMRDTMCCTCRFGLCGRAIQQVHAQNAAARAVTSLCNTALRHALAPARRAALLSATCFTLAHASAEGFTTAGQLWCLWKPCCRRALHSLCAGCGNWDAVGGGNMQGLREAVDGCSTDGDGNGQLRLASPNCERGPLLHTGKQSVNV